MSRKAMMELRRKAKTKPAKPDKPEFTKEKTGGVFYFFRRPTGALGIQIKAGRTQDRAKESAFARATVEELLENASYASWAPLVVITRREFETLGKFLPDPLPPNIKVGDN